MRSRAREIISSGPERSQKSRVLIITKKDFELSRRFDEVALWRLATRAALKGTWERREPAPHERVGGAQIGAFGRFSLCFQAAARTLKGTAFLSPEPFVLGQVSHQSAIRLEVPG